ncbi:MAG: sensor histidine kinase [Anaerolineae bacterium]|nr:MAG: sensor histidine kinase [Anaerolineae bacterium]
MAFPELTEQSESGGWDSLSSGVQQQLDQAQRDLREIDRMVEQSKGEVDKLAQRNATITMHLNSVQQKIETMAVSDVQTAYDAALDAQQRLVVMRSQLEKLQAERTLIERFITLLKQIQTTMAGGGPDSGSNGSSGSSFATAEMMIQSQEAERQRLSRQMHDGPAQTLSNFILQTEIAMKLFDVDQQRARDELSSLKAAASTAFGLVRDFIFDLRPMMLDDLGLAPTLKKYAEHFREKSSMEVSVQITGSERRLENYLEVMLFRAMQELLNNSALHSQANQIKVHLDMGADAIRLAVEDNGKGFDPDKVQMDDGLGIKLIRDRAEMLGGTFEVDSAIGQGARITLTLPADEAKS